MKLPLAMCMVIACVAAVSIVAFFVYREYDKKEPSVFYSSALRAAHIETKVSIDGVSYSVDDGEVYTGSTTVNETKALPTLQLAYAQAMARFSPVFDLTGVDPDMLQQAVERVQEAQTHLAEVQATSADASSMSSLYPLNFLSQLVSLERSRQAFLASGSDVDENKYESQLEQTATTGAQDAKSLQGAMEGYLTTLGNVSMPGLGGMITTNSLEDGITQLETRMNEASDQIARRAACADGIYGNCLTSDIAPTLPPQEAQNLAAEPAGSLSLAKQAKSLLEDAATPSGTPQIYEISSSACLAAFPGPYYFSVDKKSDSLENPAIAYIGDLYFMRLDAATQASDPFYKYLATVKGSSYIKINPLSFYICPEFGDDISRLRSLSDIQSFAVAHPTIASKERSLIVSVPVVREEDVLSYLRAALLETQTTDVPNFETLNDLSLMYKDRTAEFEDIVYEIALTNDTHATRVQEGIPFSVSAWELYLTHAAFPSLFLADNASAGSSTVSIRTQSSNNLELLFMHYIGYDTLRSSVPQNTLVHDIRALMDFEGVPHS